VLQRVREERDGDGVLAVPRGDVVGARVDDDGVALQVGGVDDAGGVAPHLLEDAGEREAALVEGHDLAVQLAHGRVEEDERVHGAVGVDHDHAHGLSDLDRGDAGARLRGAERVHEVLGDLGEEGLAGDDAHGLLLEEGVREEDEVALHGGGSCSG
jgi:hypothetical protein